MGGGNLDTDMNTGRTLCKGEGRDQGDASINQGTPKIASKDCQQTILRYPRGMKHSFLHPSKETNAGTP